VVSDNGGRGGGGGGGGGDGDDDDNRYNYNDGGGMCGNDRLYWLALAVVASGYSGGKDVAVMTELTNSGG
ncbi:hypothetical protein HAX54_029489, partial [Datura stramonium]|nr:hypothetical protein [Datura stramonium]